MSPIVFKFGGAALADASGYENAFAIIQNQGIAKQKQVWVVASASGKTTNALESVVEVLDYPQRRDARVGKILDHHISILEGLGFSELPDFFEPLKLEFLTIVSAANPNEIAKTYDSIISFGERFSVGILEALSRKKGLNAERVHAIERIRTNSVFRAAQVQWDTTMELLEELKASKPETNVWLCEGFVGGDEHKNATTLGREGSDFSASILAHCLHAESATIWKDVPGVLNADPRKIKEAVFIPNLTYSTALDMAFYGAQIIHPKSIAPLKAKQIPLYVRPYSNPESMGTCVQTDSAFAFVPPLIIFRDKQVLLELETKNFTFFTSQELAKVFEILEQYNTRLSKLENKSTHLQILIEEDRFNFRNLLLDLEQEYHVKRQGGLHLMTVLHAQESFIHQVRQEHQIIWETNDAGTVQLVYN